MKVLLERSLFEDADTAEKCRLLHIIIEEILCNNDYLKLALNENVIDCECVNDFSQDTKDYLNQAFNEFVITSSRDIPSPGASAAEINDAGLCVGRTGGEHEYNKRIFSLRELKKYINSPAYIIIENSDNDSYFLHALFRSFEDKGDFLECAFGDGKLDFLNSGGCGNVKHVIDSKLNGFGNKPKFLKMFVLLDGDKRWDTHDVKKYEKLQIWLDSLRVSWHILEKRCMENYLPIEAIKEESGYKGNLFAEWIKGFESLSPVQRDCLNIGEGFRGDLTQEEKRAVTEEEINVKVKNPNQRKYLAESGNSFVKKRLPCEVIMFYSDVSDKNYSRIEEGIGMDNFKNNFPKLFERENSVNRNTLLRATSHQDDPNELEHIVDKIHKIMYGEVC